MNSKQITQLIGRIVFWLLLALIFAYLVFPFYWAINSSLKTESELLQTPATFWPNSPVLDNYFAIFQNERFIQGLINSVIVASSTTVMCLMIGSFGAFALGKLRFRGKTPSLYLILAMTMFPQIAVLSGLYVVINTIGLHPIPAMILSYMIFTMPFTVWVMTSFFKGLPDEIMQSAEVDGATPFQTFYMILLPLTLPAMVTTGLMAFIAAWNEYLFALTFTTIDPASRTVPVAIALFTGEIAHQEPFGEIMAAAVAVTIPLIILVLVFQQKIVAGLTAGAVKG